MLKFKKSLVWLLVLCLALVCVPFAALASEGSDASALAEYVVLPDGMDESAFGTHTVTDGVNFYATLQEATQAIADAGTDGAVLYCKPDSDVGSLQHAPVVKTLTIYGNGAYVSGGAERDFDIGNTDPSGGKDITSDVTLTVKYLDGCGAWGAKATDHTVNLVFENCSNMGKVFITGTTGVLNIKMNDCAFEGVIKEAVYSNANGTIELTKVDFSNLNKAINLNHKVAGEQKIVLTDCSFTNCGNDVSADQIPVRVLSSVEGGSTALTVSGCAFSGTPEGGADILLDYGVGTATADVSGTAAHVAVEFEENVATEKEIASDESVSTSNIVYVANINGVDYKTFAEALEAAKTMTGDVTIEIFDKVTLNQALSGSYDSIKFVGKDTDAEIYLDVQGYITASGKKVAFEDLKLSKVAGGYITDAGFMNLAFGVYSVDKVTYTDCTFVNGACASSGEVIFDGCTFYRSHDRYGLWVYGAADVTVSDSVFPDIRGIKLFAEGNLKVTDLTVKNTDFSAVDGKPAIVLTSGKSVTLEGNTYNSAMGVFELDLDGVPNGTPVTSDLAPTCINDNGACGVLVDGKIYTTVAQAAEVAASGSTVTLLHNSAETVELALGVTLDKNGFEAAGVAVKAPVAIVNGVNYESVIEAILAAIESGVTEVKILASTREVMPFDVEFILKADLTITADAPVDVKFYNNGTSFDFVIDCEGYGDYDFTIAENVNFVLEDRTIWVGYYGSNIDVIVNGTLEGGYQVWIGGDVYVNATGTLKSSGEAMVLRRGKTLFVDGGKVVANYFNILAGNIFAENGAEITCGAFWIANTGGYTGEGNVSVSIWDSKLTSSGNLKSASTHAAGVTIDIYNSEVAFADFDGYGASQLDASSTLWVNGEDTSLTIKSLTNNGTVEIFDDASLTFTGAVTNNGDFIIAPGCSLKSPAEIADVTVDSGDYIAGWENGELVFITCVAKIGNQGYASLQAAIDAAQDGDIITLLADINYVNVASDADKTTSIYIPAGKKFTLDLNGYVVSGENNTNSSFAFVTICSGADVTIDDTSAAKTGKITYKSTRETPNENHEGYTIRNKGSLTLNGGTIENSSELASDGYEKCVTTAIDNCNSSGAASTFKMNGGTVVSNTYFAIRSSVYANNTLDANAVIIELNGGTVYGLHFCDWGSKGLDYQVVIGDDMVIEHGNYPELENQALRMAVATAATSKVLIEIEQGAVINGAIYGAAAKIGTMYFTNLQKAVDAAQAGDVIVILKDLSGVAVTADKSVTIKGNVTLTNVSISGSTGIELTVEDLSFTGNSWINSNGAAKLTVKNVTADVTPSNTSATNSRSAFISLGRSESATLELYVEGCSIISRGGSDPILGWAAITKADLIGNTFGSADAYQEGSDSVKFMSIADGAVFNITGNTVYSNYNGIVFAQNTTRGNAYTANISGNTFIGGADHIWIEVSGSNTNHANINASSDNTVNGNAFNAGDIKLHPNLSNFTGYLGVDVEFNAENKIIGGSFIKVSDALIASGYEAVAEGGAFAIQKIMVAEVNGVKYETLADALAAIQAGDTLTLLADVTLTETLTLPAGIILNGNGKQINGEVWAGGDLTFVGHTKVTNFNAGYEKPTITIGAGACLELTGSGRMVIGHGATFNITGTITDAKTANVAELQPSLIAAGASFTGAGVNFNVTNAYVKFTAYCSSKNSNANNTFNFNVTNSIWEQTNSFVFTEPTNGKDPTFNLNLKDSVLNSTSHLVFAVTKGEIVFDNSNVNVGNYRQLENRSTLTIKNGSVVYASVQTSSNAKNPGTTIVENATYMTTGEFSGSDVGTGTLIIKQGANVTMGKITKANIVIDATGMAAGDIINLTANLTNLAGTVSVINNDKLEAEIVGGKIVLSAKPVAKIGETYYKTLQAAINAAQTGDVIVIIDDIELVAQNAQELFKPAYNRESYCGIYIPDDLQIAIDLNGHTISYVDVYGDIDNVMILNLGHLTIKDSATDGKITYKPVAGTSTYSKFYSTIFNCGTLIINGGVIENTCETETDVSNAVDNHSRLSHEYGNDCILEVNGGSLIGAYYYAVRQYTHYLEGVKNRVTINGGTIYGGIYMQHGDSWYYANESANRLNVDFFLTINGGTITANLTPDNFGKIKSRLNNPDNNSFGVQINGGIIEVPVELLVQRGYYYENGVSGALAPTEAVGARNDEWLTKNGGFITGGTFSDLGVAGSTTDLSKFLIKGKALEANADGTYGVENRKVASVNGVKYETLRGAVDAVEDGGTIVLLGDIIIDANTRELNSGTWYDGIYIKGDKSFTLDLAGYTITQDGSVNDYLINFINQGDKANTVTIKNGTIDAADSAFCALCTSASSTQKITINLEGVKLINNVSNGSTAKIRGGAELNVKAGTVITGKNSYLAIECVASTVNIYDDAELYMNGTGSYNGCLVGVCSGGVVNVYGGYGKGVKGGFIAMTSGGTINVYGGEWIANTDGSIGNNSNLYVLTAQNNAKESGYVGASIINVYGGIFRGGMDAWILNQALGEVAELNIFGGNFNANPGSYVESGYVVVQKSDNTYDVVKAVAKVGTTYYATLQAAIDAAQNGETITLLADINEAVTISGKMITLDLNNKKIFGGNTDAVSVLGDANVTIKNGTLESTGNNCGGVWVKNAIAIIENCTIRGTHNVEAVAVYASNGATVTIKDCTLIAENANSENSYALVLMSANVTVENSTLTATHAVSSNGSDGYDQGNITIKSGDFNGLIYWPGQGTLTINGGEIDDILMKSGSMIINGGTIGDITINNAAEGGYEPIVNVAITDGTFTGTIESDLGAGFITGGTFSAPVAENLCAEGFIPKDNGDGTYGVKVGKYVAQVGDAKFESLAEALAAAQAGDTIQLLDNIVLNDTLAITKNVIIDGQGYAILPADSSETYNSAIMAGDSGWGDDHGETIKLMNIKFIGWSTNHGVVRAQGVTLVIDGCEFNGCNVSNAAYAVLSLNFADATVTNTKFINNTSRAIDVNYNGDDSNAVVTIDGCTFEGNTTTGAGIVMRSDGTLSLKNSVFKNNTVNTNGNGATVYVGFGAGNEVIGCTFEGNTVITSHATTKRFASAIFCDGCAVSGNVFGSGNTATRNGEAISTVVAVGAYYGAADISGNFWGGNAPVPGVDYTIEYSRNEVSVEDYYTDDALANLVELAYVAQVGNYKYASLQDAINVAQSGDVITLLVDLVLDDVLNIEKAITLDLNGKTVTGADGAIVFNIKAATTIKNGTILGNKSGTSSGLIDIYADLTMDGVTVETSKILALRFKVGGMTATLENCNVTGAFKGYGASVWVIKSGTYKASSTSISEQLNGTASISGGTFFYEIKEENCAPGYAVVDNGDGSYGVKYAPVGFVDANNNGALDEGEVIFGSLEAIFNTYKTGDVYIVLTADAVINNQVDTTANAKYYLNTNVAEGVTVEFAFADDWNYVQKMYIGENVTVKAPYLLAWTELEVYGNIETTYLYITTANVLIAEGAVVNANTGEATVQVKNGATLTVNGTLNTAILNVWAGESKLVVSGANAKVNASWIDIWDGAPSVAVESGATLEVDKIKVSRGGEIEVNNATLTAEKIEIGHNGESAGVLTESGNSTINGAITLTATGSTVSSDGGLNVTTDIADHKVIFENGEYKVVAKVYVAQVGDAKFESLAEALAEAAKTDDLTVIELVAGELELGSVKFPATLKNVIIKGAEGKQTIVKNSLFYSADGNSVVYEGITFDGIVFDNTQIVFTGARNGEVIYKDWTITNCEFKNIVSTANAAVHFNLASDETIENFTFTNNVINGVTGGSVSGLRLNYVSGNVTITGNDISNVAWNAIQIVNSQVDTFVVENNTLASENSSILNIYNVTTDDITIKNNKFMVQEGQRAIANLASADVSENYWGGNAPAGLPEGVTANSYYADEAMTQLIEAVAMIGDKVYYSLADALNAAVAGDTVKLVADATYDGILMLKGITLDLDGKTLIADGVIALKSASIVDTNETAKGLLKVADKDMFVMSKADYPMLPVWNEEGNGFFFVNVKVQAELEQVRDDSFKVIYRPSIKGAGIVNKDIFGDGALDNDLVMKINILCIKEGAVAETLGFVLSDDLIAEIYSAETTQAVYLTIFGATDMFDAYQIEFVIESASGISFSEIFADAFTPVSE